MGDRHEIIELSLPVNAAYVSAARLTASSIANRLGFEIDEMEDVKAAVSEACTLLIKLARANTVKHFKVIFDPGAESLSVRIHVKDIDFTSDDDGMSLMMIRALMDSVVISRQNGISELCMVKNHQESGEWRVESGEL